MKTQIIILALILISLMGMAQKMNQVKIDNRVNDEILFGQINLEGLNGTVCSSWFKSGFETYQVDKTLVSKLKKKDLTGLKMTLVLGTWCHDSHNQVPRMIKILEALEFPMSAVDLFAMDTHKQAPGVDLNVLKVKLVPTLIVFRGTKELGRIIENPKLSLEADLLNILK